MTAKFKIIQMSDLHEQLYAHAEAMRNVEPIRASSPSDIDEQERAPIQSEQVTIPAIKVNKTIQFDNWSEFAPSESIYEDEANREINQDSQRAGLELKEAVNPLASQSLKIKADSSPTQNFDEVDKIVIAQPIVDKEGTFSGESEFGANESRDQDSVNREIEKINTKVDFSKEFESEILQIQEPLIVKGDTFEDESEFGANESRDQDSINREIHKQDRQSSHQNIQPAIDSWRQQQISNQLDQPQVANINLPKNQTQFSKEIPAEYHKPQTSNQTRQQNFAPQNTNASEAARLRNQVAQKRKQDHDTHEIDINDADAVSGLIEMQRMDQNLDQFLQKDQQMGQEDQNIPGIRGSTAARPKTAPEKGQHAEQSQVSPIGMFEQDQEAVMAKEVRHNPMAKSQVDAKKKAERSRSRKSADQPTKEVRIAFNQNLSRVYNSSTFEKAVKECHRLIKEHSGDRQMVRIVISALTDKDVTNHATNMTAMGFHASMFGFLAKQFGTDMVDPLDQPATRVKTFNRIYEYLTTVMFAKNGEVVTNGCSMSIIEILNHVFPEYLMLENSPKLQKVFINPLLEIVQPKGGNSQAQQQSACYCLRRLIEYLIKEQNSKGLITTPLCDQLSEIAIKHKVPHKNYVEMLASLMMHFNSGVGGVTNNTKGLFTYTIETMEQQVKKQQNKTSTIFTSYDAQKSVQIFGKQLEDLIALLRLQKQMVELSKAFWRTVVPDHYDVAAKVLQQVKNVANVKLKAEANATQRAWDELKALASKSVPAQFSPPQENAKKQLIEQVRRDTKQKLAAVGVSASPRPLTSLNQIRDRVKSQRQRTLSKSPKKGKTADEHAGDAIAHQLKFLKNAKSNILLKGEGNAGGQVPQMTRNKSALDFAPRSKEEIVADHDRMMIQLLDLQEQNKVNQSNSHQLVEQQSPQRPQQQPKALSPPKQELPQQAPEQPRLPTHSVRNEIGQGPSTVTEIAPSQKHTHPHFDDSLDPSTTQFKQLQKEREMREYLIKTSTGQPKPPRPQSAYMAKEEVVVDMDAYVKPRGNLFVEPKVLAPDPSPPQKQTQVEANPLRRYPTEIGTPVNVSSRARQQASVHAPAPLPIQTTDFNYFNTMMEQHVKLMQQQMTTSFDMIADKMTALESRLIKSDYEQKQQEANQLHERQSKTQADVDNRKLFQRLQEAIATQQYQMLNYVDRTSKDMQNMQDSVAEVKDKNGAIQEDDINKIVDAVKAEVKQNVSGAGGKQLDEQQSIQADQQAVPIKLPNAMATLGPANQSFFNAQHNQTVAVPNHQPQMADLTQVPQKPQQKIPRLTQVWMRCTEYVKRRDYESAYRLMLKEGDDMYLLRLVVQTGPVTKYLEPTSARAVMSRMNKIVRGGIFELMEVEWIDDAKRTGQFLQMPMQEQNEYLDTLYQLGKSEIHSPQVTLRADEVYQLLRATCQRQLGAIKKGKAPGQAATLQPRQTE